MKTEDKELKKIERAISSQFPNQKLVEIVMRDIQDILKKGKKREMSNFDHWGIRKLTDEKLIAVLRDVFACEEALWIAMTEGMARLLERKKLPPAAKKKKRRKEEI